MPGARSRRRTPSLRGSPFMRNATGNGSSSPMSPHPNRKRGTARRHGFVAPGFSPAVFHSEQQHRDFDEAFLRLLRLSRALVQPGVVLAAASGFHSNLGLPSD